MLEKAKDWIRPPSYGKIATVAVTEDTPSQLPTKEQQETVAELRRKLQAAEVSEALQKSSRNTAWSDSLRE